MSEYIEKIKKIDPRWLHIATIILVAYPLINPIGWPLAQSENTLKAFNLIEHLPEKSTVCISVSMAATMFEAQGRIFKDWFSHCMKKNLKVVLLTFSVDAAGWIPSQINNAKEFNWMQGKEYGIDYIYLGYVVHGAASFSDLMIDIRKEAATDYFYSKPLDDWPITKNIRVFPDFDAWFFITGSEPKPEVAYLIIPTKKINTDFIAMEAAGMAEYTTSRIYYLSGDLDSYIIGAPDWAAYEQLIVAIGVNPWGNARGLMDSMTNFHFLLLTMVIIANVGFFLKRNKGGS
jgi:hypothetical protein